MTTQSLSSEYFKCQREIKFVGNDTANNVFQAIEELQSLIDNALIQERRNSWLGKIPLIKKYRQKLDLIPFYNREVPALLNFFGQILYATSSIIYQHESSDFVDIDNSFIKLINKYGSKWQVYEKSTNNITSANLATLNDIRIATKNVLFSYQKWKNDTIFRAEIVMRIEAQKDLYKAMTALLISLIHYERHLINEQKSQ